MIQYKIGNDFGIKQLDNRNLVFFEKRTYKEGKNEGEEYEYIHGYYPSLASSIRGASNKLGNIVETHKELMNVLELLNKIKNEQKNSH